MASIREARIVREAYRAGFKAGRATRATEKSETEDEVVERVTRGASAVTGTPT